MKILHYDILDSTMDEARRLLRDGFKEEFAILTKVQTAGRGRHGRSWQSQSGNLYLSVVTRDVDPQKLSQYALLWGVVLQQTISSLVTATVACKWPNDVLLEDKKLAGILIERFDSALIVGIGINILHHPDQVMFPATCLANYGVTCTPEELTDMLVQHYQRLRASWEKQGFDNFRNSWLNTAWKLNSEIKIGKNDESMVGIFETIDENGALILNTNGQKHKLLVGDLF